MELLKQNLAIEPDIQNFIRLALAAVSGLGGNAFAASLALLNASEVLRAAGAGTGYPLPVSLQAASDGLYLQAENGAAMRLMRYSSQPEPKRLDALRRQMQQSTEIADPALLLRRNAEMARYLDETRARTERELEVMQATLAARQRELHESLRQAETDPLTGLLNRRAFDDRLDAALRRAMRQREESLSLVLLDLDFFKQINDEHGHQYGDAYLNKMAQAMLAAIRQDVDMAFRFGGDEFAMLIAADGRVACEKASQVLNDMGQRVSIGITSIHEAMPANMTRDEFFRLADEALYKAKRNGRGRVVMEPCCARGQAGCIEECPHKALAA